MSRLIIKRKSASPLYQKTITTLGDVLRKQLDPFSINPNCLFFSDLHLHDRKEFSQIDPVTGLNTRLAEGLNILDQIITICKDHPSIKTICYLGDVFERKDNISNQILIEFKKRIEKFCEIGIPFYSLRGNHDFNLPDYPILNIFDKEDYFHFIDHSQWNEPFPGSIYFIPYHSIYFIPYQRRWEEFETIWKVVHKSKKPDILCFHQEIPGGVYESGKSIPGQWVLEMDPNILYLSGHLHLPQKVHNIQFLGSPYQVKFFDSEQDYYIWLLNSKTRELQPLQLNYSKFISLKYYDLDIPAVEDFREIVNGNYIRITGEVNREDIDSKVKKNIKEKLESFGAKVVIFQTKVKHQLQTEISESAIKDDTEIIYSYAKQNIIEGLELLKLTEIGQKIYESL